MQHPIQFAFVCDPITEQDEAILPYGYYRPKRL
ncbi:hypothetical protein ANAEL_05146 [Anaerolineales bacterium]|nr:hypothetical protein ANAEL_05146 [Anaerolineales bacterium]